MESPQLSPIITQLQSTVAQRAINYDLSQVLLAAQMLDNPHHSLPPVIHVAGTNGKGSTIAFLEALLLENGFSVGKYTSPHLQSYRERFQFNQEWISDTDFIRYFQEAQELSLQLTEFEQLTLMAFLYFKNAAPDYLLLETGLGGRLDATNIVTPIASVITPIDKDHESILGATTTQIAQEKAGIIKPNIPVITAPQSTSVLEVLQQAALTHHTVLIQAHSQTPPQTSPLQGRYQSINFGTAMTTLTALNIPIKHPILCQKTNYWGRFTTIKNNHQTIIIDAAHNTHGIHALLESVKEQYPELSPAIICGFLTRKDISLTIPLLTKAAHSLYYCPFSTDAHSFTHIQTHAPHAQEWQINTTLPKHPLVIITGSIYFLGMLDRSLMSTPYM